MHVTLVSAFSKKKSETNITYLLYTYFATVSEKGTRFVPFLLSSEVILKFNNLSEGPFSQGSDVFRRRP